MESSNKNDKNLQQKIRKVWFNLSEVDMKKTLHDIYESLYLKKMFQTHMINSVWQLLLFIVVTREDGVLIL